jgi:hypothetical protein
MAFDQTVIADVAVFDHLGDLGISWRSAAPAGTTFQVYLDRALSWAGVARRAIVPMPDVGREVRVDVGAVGEGEGGTDFSASLPAAPGGGRTVRLDWRGGTYEDLGDDIAGFHVYMSAVAGAAVNYGVPVATVEARSSTASASVSSARAGSAARTPTTPGPATRSPAASGGSTSSRSTWPATRGPRPSTSRRPSPPLPGHRRRTRTGSGSAIPMTPCPTR